MKKEAAITRSIARPDGYAKATGTALYVADLPFGDAEGDEKTTDFGGVALGSRAGLRTDFLYGRFYRSPHPRGRITSLRLPNPPEGYHIITASNVPGENKLPLGPSLDWPCFASEEVRYVGEIVAIVVGSDPVIVDRLLGEIELDVDPLSPVVSLDDSLHLIGGPIHGEDNVFCRVELDEGDVDAAFSSASKVVEGIYNTGFQEQFYMEGQGLITWREGGRVGVRGSMQCPYYVNHAVAHVLGLSHKDVRVIQDTVGGGFGGKEDYPEIMGAPMAVASWVTGKPVRLIMDRVEDMAYTSKRHPSRSRYRTALDEKGKILAMDILIDLDGGAYESYTKVVLMRAAFTSMGVYSIPAFRIRGRGLATNTAPSGAFRGFGAPQALFALEMHMEEIARQLGVESLPYKQQFFLKKGSKTVTSGEIRENVILGKLIDEIETLSNYSKKRAQYKALSLEKKDSLRAKKDSSFAPSFLRGIGLSFINHGCGFTGNGEQELIKAEASLVKKANGKVDILCAAVDFGQGPQTTFRKVVGTVLGLKPEEVGFDYPDTDRMPDSGPTVASRTIMIVGYLLQKAAEDLKKIWKDGQEQRINKKYTMPPGMAWNQETLQGDAYASYGWGVNVCEVEVDTLTWETKVLGVWALFDVGVAIDRRVVDGQIQGGMSQALGYAAMEKLEVDEQGRFQQITMADYMVPTTLDFPRTVAGTVDNPYPYGAFGAKGMGEMVHDAGHAAYAAAVEQALGCSCPFIPLTPEKVLFLMEDNHA